MRGKLHHDWATLSKIRWDHFSIPNGSKSYIQDLVSFPSQTFFKNIDTSTLFWETSNSLLPITVNHTEYDNAYTASFYTYYTSCALKEVQKFTKGIAQTALEILIHSIKSTLRYGKINQVVLINNWLFATNLYPQIEPQEFGPLIETLASLYPQHALVFRSLDERLHASHLAYLQKLGCQLIPYRQVFYIDRENDYSSKARMVKSDAQLAQRSQYKLVTEFTPSDYPRMIELYHQLYIEKHFEFHPQFTLVFMESALRNQFLHLIGLRGPDGILDGVAGYYFLNGVMTVPFIGYNTEVAVEAGLYRILNHYLLQVAKEQKLLYHLSSGTATFKQLRRAVPAMEWVAVYSPHLASKQRFLWKGIDRVMNTFGKRLIQLHG